MAIHRLERKLNLPAPFHRLARHFLDQPCGFLLDSSMSAQGLGRFSFLGCRPTALWTARISEDTDGLGRRLFAQSLQRWWTPDGPAEDDRHIWTGDPFAALRDLQATFSTAEAPAPGAWPLTGGLVGYLGFGLGHAVEKLSCRATDDLGLPDAAFIVADEILAHDHRTGRTSLLVTGRGPDPDAARVDAEQRVRDLEERLSRPLPELPEPPDGPGNRFTPARGVLAGPRYMAAVDRCRRHIEAGEVFEVCLTHRLEADLAEPPWAVYERLRAINPAPFASFLHFPGFAVVSASPERFLRLDGDGLAESRPIKGTRPRGDGPEEDARLRADLAGSEKDRAENVMIVDLVRNDLGRVCETGSVTVPELLAIEEYATVFQLVSTVQGRLTLDRDAFDLVRAAFPGGSMTGAPKIAALNIIDAIEPVTRGIYSGAIGYFDRSGVMDLSIVIRTLVCRGGKAYLGVGGAVVADSDPAQEYQETLDKARALLTALRAEFPPPGAG